MSYFGDRTPHQELLETVRRLQDNFGLTDEQATIILLVVTSAILDSCDTQSEELRNRRAGEEIPKWNFDAPITLKGSGR